MQTQTPTGGSPMGSFIVMILVLVIFWFLLIRPQNQRMKKHRQMLEEIKRGDEIVTNGGLKGKVTKSTEKELIVDFGEGNKMTVMRAMVADVLNRPEPANDRPAKGKK